MKTPLIEKARANRNAALDYVDTQKSKLVLLAGLTRGQAVRAPFPVLGFATTRRMPCAV
ncbi:hypothetical protein [Ovoidimarina sediminis]|uniref:hypothetical protein n=1 Tax=Ovoidimarina sediminis TaxID=3079856 RepID=UPI002912CADB|nr:hypothetical protein [Rhodophyticola sp. MJ-SS7]MDU8944486.1 hypothetical protein [Rhodophyticola sp. MJ-SS7]